MPGKGCIDVALVSTTSSTTMPRIKKHDVKISTKSIKLKEQKRKENFLTRVSKTLIEIG